jgi:hypothetical protein
MRRITTWIAAALAVVAIAAGYQVSQSGDDAQGGAPVSAQTAPSTSSTDVRPDDGRSGGTPDQHTDKPGENK